MAKPTEPDSQFRSPSYQGRRLFIVLKSQEKHEETKMESGDDLTNNVKNTLIDYVVKSTKDSGNQFPLSTPRGNDVLTTANGNPSALSQAETNNQETYLGTFDKAGGNAPTAARSFRSLSTSGMFGEDFRVRRGKEETQDPSGDEIYRDIDQNGASSDFVQRVQRVLFENNSYNESKPFIDENATALSDDDITLGTTNYRRLGESAPRKFPSVSTTTPDDQIKIRDMKKIALLTMLQATGELVTPNFSDSNAQDTLTGQGALTSMAPGLARVGIRIPVSRFMTANVIKPLKPSTNKRDFTSFLDGKTVLSYGNVNSYFVPFDGLSNVPSLLSATIMMTTVAGLLKTLSLLRLANNTTTIVTPAGSPEARAPWMGSYRGNLHSDAPFQNPQILDLVPTNHEFFACLDRGISSFFGLDQSTPEAFVASATSQLAKLNGYYNVVLRNVIRSVNDFISPIADALGEGQGNGYKLDPLDVRNVVDPFANIKKLNNSALIKFVNMLASIGDKVLSAEEQHLNQQNVDLLPSDIDNISELISVAVDSEDRPASEVLNPATLIAKNRLSSRAGKLAMGNTTLRSLLLVPNNIIRASNALPGTANVQRVSDLLSGDNTVVTSDSDMENGRIKASLVEKIEDYLERDYMPFYFHDVRTNEILSFHAFLGELTEGLSADYNETEGYGRVGGVYTYKNTKREISLSFKMLATDENDFDQMWYKINRLAAMLYPQWSEGRRVSFGQNRFIQPFSQVPSASPLVRLRFGDMLKSNYSKFAAARLFGLGNGIGQDGAFNLENLQSDATSAQNERSTSQTFTDRASRVFRQQQAGNYLDQTPSADQSRVTQKVSFAGRNQRYTIVNGVAGRTTQTPQLGQFDVRVVSVYDNPVHTSTINQSVRWYVVTPVSPVPGGGHRPTFTGNFAVPSDRLVPRMDYILEGIRGVNTDGTSGTPTQSSTNATANSSEQLNNFFNSTGNPIMKAFESTKGRGLAGFIRSMRLDYKDATWLTDKANGRAPMLVDISIEFIPIHDIQPGLDSNGYMTAPIWNVGNVVGNMHDAAQLQNTMELMQQARSNLSPPRN